MVVLWYMHRFFGGQWNSLFGNSYYNQWVCKSFSLWITSCGRLTSMFIHVYLRFSCSQNIRNCVRCSLPLPLSLSSPYPFLLSPPSPGQSMLIYHLKLKSAVLGNGCSDHKNNDIFDPKGLKESWIGQPYNLLSVASSLPLFPLIPLPSLTLSLPPPPNKCWLGDWSDITLP